MYARFFKRFIDFCLALFALLVLSPLFTVLIVVGAIAMKGNPFFTQLRPGKIDEKTGKERIFRLIKFRTMSNAKDKEGNLLPDEVRLNGYGKFLRKASLDELPEIFNILIGNMSIVGPRPLVVQYLPWYNDSERHRHDIRPGLTGLAQINGRNCLQWEERFAFDLEYVNHITLLGDLIILFKTLVKVLKHADVVVRGTGDTTDFDVYRKAQMEVLKNDIER